MNDSVDPYDDAFDEGVRNWNILQINAAVHTNAALRTIMVLPEAVRACQRYAAGRYLGMLSTDEVFERYRTLCALKDGMDEHGYWKPNEWNQWADKWVHAAVELALRHESLDDTRAKPDLAFYRTPRVIRAAAAAKRSALDWGSHPLVKYGEARFLREALTEGRIRISPASSYDDPSLNFARRDAELERHLTDTALERTAILGHADETVSDDERALYNANVRSAVDYYIFCLAGGYQLRLFDDFDVDACLVITDSIRFLTRLREAVADALPMWRYGNAMVRYIDPVQTLSGPSAVELQAFAPFFCKHYRYSYQNEIRIAWLPPTPEPQSRSLNHVFVTLGRLEEYCELVEL